MGIFGWGEFFGGDELFLCCHSQNPAKNSAILNDGTVVKELINIKTDMIAPSSCDIDNMI